jgi:RHS repeat-associated protein
MLVNNNGTVVNSFAYDAFGTLIASNTAAQTRYLYSAQQYDSDLGLYYNRARYLNANSGRFWTRDTYSGDTEDPISLHKYLYAKCNPVNIVDPSGHDGSEVELAAVTAIGAGVDAMGAVAVAGAEVAAETGVAGAVATAEIGTAAATEGAVAAETAALAETGVETAEVAAEVVEAEEGEGFLETAKQTLRQFGKTVKELIEDAKKIAKNNPFKVVPMPGNVIPDVTRNIINAFAEAKPFELTRCSKVVAIENRELAIGNYLKNPVRGLNGSFDEYPFASSKEGGANSRVTPVPLWQNCVQGGIIAASYKIQDINEGVPFTVVPIPRIGK